MITKEIVDEYLSKNGLIITNGLIKNTFLGIEDHGYLTAELIIEFPSWTQAFGGYSFGYGLDFDKVSYKTMNLSGYWINKTLAICGVRKWDSIPGKAIRVISNHTKLLGIGHIIKDLWFIPEIDFAELEVDKEKPTEK
jgi:hypothetical protein